MTRLLHDLAFGAAAAIVIAGLGYTLGHLWPAFGAQLGIGVGVVVLWAGGGRA